MGLQVIAEGIEDLDQADWLLRHGCAMAQGYAFGRPAPLPSTAQLLIEELTEAPVQELTEQTPESLTAPAAELAPGTSTTVTADLTDELAELTEDAADSGPSTDGGAVPELPVQRTSGPTGEFPRPPFPGPADAEPDADE
jgi:hypothetical protein